MKRIWMLLVLVMCVGCGNKIAQHLDKFDKGDVVIFKETGEVGLITLDWAHNTEYGVFRKSDGYIGHIKQEQLRNPTEEENRKIGTSFMVSFPPPKTEMQLLQEKVASDILGEINERGYLVILLPGMDHEQE